jgi:hypothetical protein
MLASRNSKKKNPVLVLYLLLKTVVLVAFPSLRARVYVCLVERIKQKRKLPRWY